MVFFDIYFVVEVAVGGFCKVDYVREGEGLVHEGMVTVYHCS